VARQVVLLGGGYAALGLVPRLRSAVRRRAVEVTVVDRENFHFYHGLVGNAVSGEVGLFTRLSPARHVYRPAHFYHADVDGFDLERRRVFVSHQRDGSQHELTFDDLPRLSR
jgi:NADH dehydrogenase FAD-containing subunit